MIQISDRQSITNIRKVLTILATPTLSGSEPRPRNKDVLRLISGVIFFGTPHVRNNDSKNWHRLTNLLKFTGVLPSRFLASSEREARTAVFTCDEFERSRVEMQVISIYETKNTKIKTHRYWPLRDELPVRLDHLSILPNQLTLYQVSR